MHTTTSPLPETTDKPSDRISLLLLAGLIFLRFPYLIGAAFTLGTSLPIWAYAIFDVGTYLLTALLIWRERTRLQDFWIDLAAAVTFLLQMFCFPIGIGLFWKMGKAQAKFPLPPARMWRWMLAGAFLAIGVNLLLNAGGLNQESPRGPEAASLAFLLPALFTQMTNAAVWEEPLFRGFLWGFLRRARWGNGWIWLFQAGLFALGHIYYLRTESFGPWLIRMMVPALLIGLIAWQARSIFASMVTHGMFNAYRDMLLHTRSLSESIALGWVCMAVLIGLWIIVWGLQVIRRRGGGELTPLGSGE